MRAPNWRVHFLTIVVVSLPYNAFFRDMRRTRVDRDRAHTPNVGPEGGSRSGVRNYGGMGISCNEGSGQKAIQDTIDRDHLSQMKSG